jgi:hypothetical protein
MAASDGGERYRLCACWMTSCLGPLSLSDRACPSTFSSICARTRTTAISGARLLSSTRKPGSCSTILRTRFRLIVRRLSGSTSTTSHAKGFRWLVSSGQPPPGRLRVIVYGLADSDLVDARLGEVFELFVERDSAVEALRDILTDEPSWADRIRLVPTELLG